MNRDDPDQSPAEIGSNTKKTWWPDVTCYQSDSSEKLPPNTGVKNSQWVPDLITINIKKRTCKIVEFAVPADNRIKLKEYKKKISTSNLVGI